MLFATFLGLLLIPVFYVSVRRMLGDKLDEPSRKMPHHGGDNHQPPASFDSDPHRGS
jgi:multidrug efflux pump